ncbi:MAG TPA: TraB/GumN family protein [Steroidobacteraceae bacterium]|nr:TraB/GumN family protein [Steroidobacteraceae bacterium]
MGRTTLRWLLGLGLLGCLSAQAASPVWAVRGPHNIVYLAGSIHMLPADDAALPAGFTRAYADSTKLVMELDLAKFDPMEAMTWMMDHGTLPAGTTLRGLLGEQRYGRVSGAAASLGMPMAGLDSLAPWVVGIEITDAAYEHEGFDPDQGVEEQLLRLAQSDHKPTAGLETLPEELGSLSSLSSADQIRMLDQTVDELKDLKSEMREVTGAWRSGDRAHLAALLSSEYGAFPSLYKPLVTDRNQRWLPQVEQLLNGKDNAFVVVGALHLVGDGGLLELLRRKGYTITQLN